MARSTSLLTGAIAAVALAGCAISPPQIAPSPDSRPLDAYIYGAQNGRVQFDLSRPAYAALFQIVPGQGTVLLYPGGGGGGVDGASFAGINYARPAFHGNYYGFLPAATGYAGPRFYFLIASEEPLEIDRFGAYGSALSSNLGVHFASFSAYSTMERLVELAVPNVQSESWTTDFYVQWPNVLHSRPGPELVRIQCDDYVAWVPLATVLAATEAICPAGSENTPRAPTVPQDSTDVVQPIRRPPVEPVTDRIASSQLEAPEEWTVRRRAAEVGISLSPEDLDALDAPGIRERVREGVRENPAIGRGRGGTNGGIGARAIDRGSDTGAGIDRGTSSPPPSPRAEPSSGPERSAPRDNPPAVSRDNQ